MPARFTTPIVAVFILAACGAESRSPTSPTLVSQPSPALVSQTPCTNTAWSADHETGDLAQWYVGGGGGEFNSGAATSRASQDVAHSGRYSAEMTIRTPVESAVRLFRWNESRAHPEARYSVWFYFPQRYTAPVWWNIFSFKSRNGTAANDPFWSLQAGNRPGGAMYVFLNWWDGLSIEGPHPRESGGRNYSQTRRDIPIRQWMHLEVYLRQSSAFDGQITVWQDGVELFNLNNVRTRYPASNGANEWAVNNYSEIIVPSPTTIYIDDVLITACIGSGAISAAAP